MARTVWRESPEKVEDCDQSALDSHELHVLAVDDSLVDRKVIERLLKISSCKVTAVESGSRALQYLGLDGEKSSIGLEDLKVNLIMTDYSMPGMTGYELLKKIKTSSTLRKIPVVIMSSENILARIDRCLEEGAEDFLVKPVKLSDVKRLKDFILRGEGEENGEKGTHKRKIKYNPLSASPPLPPSPHCHRKDFKMRGGEGEEHGQRGTHKKRKLKDDPLFPFPPPSPSPTTLKSHSKRPRL